MKYCIFTIVMLTTFNCNYKDTSSGKNDEQSSFSRFLVSFDTLKLPLSITKFNDFSQYSDSIWRVVDGQTRLLGNPIIREIRKSEYGFIKKKYPIRDQYHYFALSKATVNDYIVLLFKQSNHLEEEYWIKLNLYSNSGILLDTLTIAGQKVNVYDRYCEIDTNFSISIRIFQELFSEESNRDLLNAMETFENYVITKDGQFKLLERKSIVGNYRLEGNNMIKVE
jgi:hypothetical protein